MIRDPHLDEIVRLDGELDSAHREIERLNKQLGEVLRENRRMMPVYLAATDFADKVDRQIAGVGKFGDVAFATHDLYQATRFATMVAETNEEAPKVVREMPLDGQFDGSTDEVH